MATFGHKIAAACDDRQVCIYDSVTGVLRLSLSLVDPVQAIRGSPDGSVLFCAHKTPSITAWDTQTGGLIHTFRLNRNAEDLAVSSKGHYLACGLFDGPVKVWEVAENMDGTAIWTRSPFTHFCWLEPEERLAVSIRALVRIWDVVAGTLLHTFTIQYPVDHMVYSQKFNRLAIMAGSAPGGTIIVIDPQMGTTVTSHSAPPNLSCFAFSQTTEELVCGTETRGIQLFDISTRRFKHIEHPGTLASVSSLQNGTVVANFVGSGIQLLSLGGGHTPFQQPNISALKVHAFDCEEILAIFPTSRDHILLLEPVTMSQLLKIPLRTTGPTPSHTTILCASHKNLVAAYYFEEGGRGYLQLWRFHEEVPRWTVEADGMPEIGRVSPTAVRLVTFHPKSRLGRVCVWNVYDGQLDAQLEDIPPTSDIIFDSDERIYLNHILDRTLVVIEHPGRVTPITRRVPPRPHRPHRPHEGLPKRWYNVDKAHEWVVVGSRRICWIPSGYIGSNQAGYVWIGTSLVMVGQDGLLRKLTFLP